MIGVRIATFDQLVDECGELFKIHALETEGDTFQQQPSLNTGMYHSIESMGMLICLIAYKDAQPVGYVMAFNHEHQHYKIQVCQHDMLYVIPELRNSSAGGRLMRAVKERAIELGAQKFFWHAKPGTAFYDICSKRADIEEVIFKEDI